MLSIAEQRLQQFKANPFSSLDNSKFSPKEFNGPVEFPEFNLQLRQGDNEDLSFAKDAEFDIYLGNLSLHLVDSPERMLTEAKRVLKKGGRIGVSVWGRRENSVALTLMSKLFAKHGIESPKERSAFYLNDREALIKMFEKAGFTDVLSWYQFAPFKMIEASDKEFWLNNMSFRKLKQEQPEKAEAVRKDLEEEFAKVFKDHHHPIGLEGLLLIAKNEWCVHVVLKFTDLGSWWRIINLN